VRMGRDNERQNTSIRSGSAITPQHGVVTLSGYGIQARVDRGHLLVEDGIGAARRHASFPRVGHGVRRLVVIGLEGMVSLAALRWLGFPLLSTNATFRGSDFEAADIPLCSGPQACSPSRLPPPLRLCRRAAKALTSGQNVLRCLRTHRIRHRSNLSNGLIGQLHNLGNDRQRSRHFLVDILQLRHGYFQCRQRLARCVVQIAR
jgi:hypothetical protein